MAFTGPLEDRILIRELYGAYADTAFRKDKQGWLDCWADGGTWATAFGTVTGHAELAAQWETIWRTFRSMGFFSEVGAIEVAGDHATGRAYCREILDLGDGRVRKLVGAYHDELVRSSGSWRFARRTYTVLIAEEPA